MSLVSHPVSNEDSSSLPPATASTRKNNSTTLAAPHDLHEDSPDWGGSDLDGFQEVSLAATTSALISTESDDILTPLVEKPLPISNHPETLTATAIDLCKTKQITKSPSDPSKPRKLTKSPSKSPSKEKSAFMPTLTGDSHGEIHLRHKSSGLGTWFKGSSAPVTLGVSLQDGSETPSSRPTGAPMEEAPKMPPTPVKRPAPAVGRFSFLSSKITQIAPAPQPPIIQDEFLDLDIAKALGQASKDNLISTPSVDDVQATAETMLMKMQTAYRMRMRALQEAESEKSALQDERDEADTRTRHLKMQLEQMACRVTEQETAMAEIARELTVERRKRREEEEARKQSILLIKSAKKDTMNRDPIGKRRSNATFNSDSGFDSGEESSAESIFSQPGDGSTSPTYSNTSRASSPEPDLHRQIRDLMLTIPQRPAPVQRTSTFDKVLRGMSTIGFEEPNGEDEGNLPSQVLEQRRGNGSTAWRLVDSLREENRGLREKVTELEGAVEACLDVVGGLKGGN
ncbi:MAG: hypothetical protein M1817_006351 [Caeruleum heppii]|nr:MAG: hypothetical protein M1817_006351 [Caeruleum heppii]